MLSVVDAHPGPLSQQAVADRLGLTKGTVSRQIDAAVSAGLMVVRTAPHTRRENVLTLTPAGTDLVRRGDVAFTRIEDAIMARLVRADLDAALAVLSTLNDALDKVQPTRRGDAPE